MEPLRPRRRAAAGPNLTPMIDVVFLLVVFFMISTTFAREEPGLALELPPSEAAASSATPDDLVLELDRDGVLVVDGAPSALDELAERLAAHGAGDGRVVLRADAAVPHGRVVEVLDACRSAGVHDLAIATSGPG